MDFIKKYRIKSYIMSILLFALFSGCEKNDHSPDGGEAAYPTKVHFSLSPALLLSEDTKAGVGVNETSVANIWILQFNGTTDGAVLIKSEYKASVADISNLEVTLFNGTGHRVIFLANTYDATLFNSTNAPLNTYTFASYKAKKSTYTSESSVYTGSPATYLRMYGSYTGDIPNKSSSVLLYRNFSKITLNYTSQTVTEVTDGVRFRITSVQLKNVPSTSSLIADCTNTVLTNPSSVINYATTTGSKTGTGTGEAYTIADYTGFVTYYMPENISGVNASATTQSLKALYAPTNATYLEIKGEGIGNDGRLNEYATFKLYLGNNLTTNYNINVNTHYIITLTFKGLNISDSRLTITRVSDTVSWDPVNL